MWRRLRWQGRWRGRRGHLFAFCHVHRSADWYRLRALADSRHGALVWESASGAGRQLRRGMLGSWFLEIDADLFADLEAVGCSTVDIDTVVLTHLDFDHVAGLLAGTWPSFRGGRVSVKTPLFSSMKKVKRRAAELARRRR